MNHKETFNTGPPALPQGVTGNAALGPGVRRGHGGVCSDLSLLLTGERMGSCVNVVNYHDVCHLQIIWCVWEYLLFFLLRAEGSSMLEPEDQPKDSQALSQAAFGTGQGSPPEEAESRSQKDQERLLMSPSSNK